MQAGSELSGGLGTTSFSNGLEAMDDFLIAVVAQMMFADQVFVRWREE